MLLGCTSKKSNEKEVKKYVCTYSYGEGGAQGSYTVDYQGDSVIFTEERYWDMTNAIYDTKNYEKIMKNEAEALSDIKGVTVTYTADSVNKVYSTKLIYDMAVFDSVTYFDQVNFYRSSDIRDLFEDWLASSDPDYHKVTLKEILNSDPLVTCE